MHAVEPGTALTVPEGHSVQADEPAEEKYPALQVRQATDADAVAAVFRYWPAEHAVHVAEAAPAYDPAAQWGQVDEPASE